MASAAPCKLRPVSPEFNDWLRLQAFKNEASGASRTYGICERSTSAPLMLGLLAGIALMYATGMLVG